MEITDPLDTSPVLPGVTGASDEALVDQTDFLNLLVTQLENQDPFNPTDNEQFVAQLTQFSSLEQLIEANDNLAVLQEGQESLANAQLLELIGSEVLVTSDLNAYFQDGTADPIVYELGEVADSVTLEIRDGTGNVLETIELDGTSAGQHTFTWDKGDLNLEDGNYEFTLTATDGAGETLSIEVYELISVEGVDLTTEIPILTSRGQEIPYLDIVEFR